jgi:hypothetical protein
MGIKIKGHDIGYRFNNYAIDLMPQIKGAVTVLSAHILRVLWGGYQGLCYYKQIDPEITFQDLVDWADEHIDEDVYQPFFVQMTTDFQNSQSFKKKKDKLAKQEADASGASTIEKKNSTLPTFTPSSGEQSDLLPDSTT